MKRLYILPFLLSVVILLTSCDSKIIIIPGTSQQPTYEQTTSPQSTTQTLPVTTTDDTTTTAPAQTTTTAPAQTTTTTPAQSTVTTPAQSTATAPAPVITATPTATATPKPTTTTTPKPTATTQPPIPIEGKLDRDRAMEYAEKNWNKGFPTILCAEFTSRCLKFGGIENVYYTSSTQMFMRLKDSNAGIMKKVYINADHTATPPPYAKPGDVIFIYCPGEGLMIHTMIYAGVDEKGRIKAYSHNPWVSNEKAYVFEYGCYSCGTKLTYIEFFHFYDSHTVTQTGTENPTTQTPKPTTTTTPKPVTTV